MLGLAGGPYGDPNRFDVAATEGMTMMDVMQGEFPRTISLFRTSYSFVAQVIILLYCYLVILLYSTLFSVFDLSLLQHSQFDR